MKEPEFEHAWEIVTMQDGRKEKRCEKCFSSYEYGHDIPCLMAEKKKILPDPTNDPIVQCPPKEDSWDLG